MLNLGAEMPLPTAPTGGAFWGPSDSKVDFCEDSYAVCRFIAEFYNSLSSLIYVLFGLWGLRVARRTNVVPIVQLIFLCQAVIGAGSTIFHGTMRWWGELLDELPMLALGALFLLGLRGCHPLTTGRRGAALYTTMLCGIVCAGIAYVQFQAYEIFLHSFTAIIAVAFLICHASRHHSKQTRLLLYLTSAELLLARLVWGVERAFCDYYPPVAALHVVWHVLSAYAAYHFTHFIMAFRYEKLGYSAVWCDSPALFAEKSAGFRQYRFQPFTNFKVSSKTVCRFGSFLPLYRHAADAGPASEAER